MAIPPAILLLDTCLLLDIIRAPVRENIRPHDVAAILTLVTRQTTSPSSFLFAVTQQVKDEYAVHVDAVEQETARALEKLISQVNGMLASVAAFKSGVAPPAPFAVRPGEVAAGARSMADNLLGRSVTIPHTMDDSHAATRRVLQALPPATQAKQ